ncbi:MAG: EamA family transporter [Candidatus Kuenenia sp.]|uniref:EamA family transporter n=1 Tax=Candidatus Kuenenia sp. TaxID=2499824 RepID=UPI0022BC7721|nr:EamA family transporter [Candidatus Kuenenia sp.]MCZ7623087.1 EamA family transporter [Candidatus Kuenenia sp.]
MAPYYLAIITAILWGTVAFLEKVGLSSVEPMTAYIVRSSGVVIGVIIIVLFTSNLSAVGRMGIKSICCLVLAGLLAGFIAQVIFFKAIKTGEISKVVPITSSAPLFTFFLVVFFWERRLPFPKLWVCC